MFLRTLPLRLKLIAAVLIPLAVVAGFLTVQVVGGLEDRTAAESQLAEVLRFEAVAEYATALGVEASAIADPASTSDDLAAARDAADAAWGALASPEIGLASNKLSALASVQTEVGELRGLVGTDPAAFRSTAVRGGSNALADNPATRLTALRGQALSIVGFERAAITDPAIAQLVNDVQLLERIDSNLASEGALLVSARIALGTDMESALVDLHDAISRTDESIAVFAEVASPEAQATLAQLTATSEWARLESVRDSLRGTQLSGPGVTMSVPELQQAFAAVDQSLTTAEIQQTEALQLSAQEALTEANGQLIRAGAIGGGLLLLVAIIVFVLYQAIRQPLRDLTQEAQRVTEVELPEVVRAVRAGETGAGENIEQIDAYTNDEVGELVAAFNGLHRTAVDLAAEQAGSRRVVADMFVNLGRRNQKLLNRMLKGLTVLEREEQDPDKLEALYKVDHLATRMRRNAESLLILAGASQARSWSKSVPVYDVMQAALAEVENFERVEIEVTDEELVKGDYVADLAHILAELTENALSFSPPGSQVDVLARQTRRGYAIVITDAGIGMPADQLEQANARIIAAASQGETPSEFLGHYVVGRLAARHGFTVDLLEGISGLSVRVLLPDAVFDRAEVEAPSDLSGLSSLSQAAIATEPTAVAEEAFASVPESLPIDSIPAHDTIAEMDAFEADFATVPADSLDIDMSNSALEARPEPEAATEVDDSFATVPADSLDIDMGVSPIDVDVETHTDPETEVEIDDSFATVPADSLDWAKPADADITDEHARPASDHIAEEPPVPEAVPAAEDVTPMFDKASVPEEAPVAEEPPVPEAVPAAEDVTPMFDETSVPKEAPVPEEAPVAEHIVADAPIGDPAQPLVPPLDLPQRRPKRPAVEQPEQVPAPATSLSQPPSGTPSPMPEPTPVAAAAPAMAGAFGVRRRTPGANLPLTTIAPKNTIETDLDNPDAVRSSLSGFQSGTTRADKENI